MSSIISIASHKGGVGKTASTLNIGVSLANAGYKVLLIDGDPQASLSMAVDMKRMKRAGLCQVVSGEAKADDVVVDAKRISLSMAHLGIDTPTDVFRVSHGANNRQFISLRDLIKSLSQMFDFTLIDTANNVGFLNATLIGSSNSVIIPIASKANSVQTLPLLLKLINRIKNKLNPELAILGLIFAMLNVNNPYELEVLSILRETFPRGTFFSTFIPFSTTFDKAEMKALPVNSLPGAEELHQAYANLSREIVQRQRNNLQGLETDEYPEKLF